MTVDPTDDCTFFYTNEYLKANGTFNWSTRIASFKFPSCGSTPPVLTTITVSPASASVQTGRNATLHRHGPGSVRPAGDPAADLQPGR